MKQQGEVISEASRASWLAVSVSELRHFELPVFSLIYCVRESVFVETGHVGRLCTDFQNLYI
jgi:hypothetical protein